MIKIKKLLIKVWSYLYIYSRRLKKKRPQTKSTHVALIISGGMGDAFLDVQAFEALVEKYTCDGISVHIASVPAICAILQMIPSLSGVHIVPSVFLAGEGVGMEAFTYFKQTIAELGVFEYEQVILKLNRNNLRARCVGAALTTGCITAVMYDDKPRELKKKLLYLSLKHAVDVFMSFSDDLMQMQRSREFVMAFGAHDYPIGITYLPPQPACVNIEQPYITVTIDSKINNRRWPTGNFILLIQKLLEQYSCDVVITGAISKDTLDQYEAAFRGNDRVINMVGKTNLCEWIELIRGAWFHVSVDSGSVHVAASVGTQAFCLTGVWDRHRFFPYQIEKKTPGTAAPICIYRTDVDVEQLPCANCHVYGDYGWGNRECTVLCSNEQPCLCLERIRVDDVFQTIEQVMGPGR